MEYYSNNLFTALCNSRVFLEIMQKMNKTNKLKDIEVNLNRDLYIDSFGVIHPEPFIIIKPKNEIKR